MVASSTARMHVLHEYCRQDQCLETYAHLLPTPAAAFPKGKRSRMRQTGRMGGDDPDLVA